MQILSVTLKNFKTHREKHIEFQPGINAISGENGAGKTSLLEAIAWVLFNYQGDYAKEDLIRNGSGNAQVIVGFTSNYDGRTYEVQRCTQRGYTLFDPQLNERLPYSRIKDEVLPWLKQHIGVASTTNLPQLFARIVGVPQGTFTADFLQPAEQRKTVFDTILKVEDYKLAYKQMNTLRRYAEDQVAAVKGQIDQYEESLAQWAELQQRHQTLQEAIHEQQQQLAHRQKSLAQLETQRQTYQQQQQRIQVLQGQQQQLHQQVLHKQEVSERLGNALQQAQKAITLCQTYQADYEGYQTADQALQQVNQQLGQRQRLQDQYQALQTTRNQHQARLAQLRAELDSMVKTEQDLAALAPQIAQQIELETQTAALHQYIAQLQKQQLEGQNLEQQLKQLQHQAQSLEQTCQRLAALQDSVASIGPLEERRDRIQQQLSRLEAARQFEAELRQLVAQSQEQQNQEQATIQAFLKEVEVLAAGILTHDSDSLSKLRAAIKQSEATMAHLLEGLSDILQDLDSQTDEAKLRQALSTLQKEISQRYGWRGELAQLDALQAQLRSNQYQQTQLQQHIQTLAAATAQRNTAEGTLAQLQQQIKELGYPREKSEILQRSLTNKPQLETAYNTLLSTQRDQDTELAKLITALDAFTGLDQTLAELQQRREAHQTGYTLYLRHQAIAEQHPKLQQELDISQNDLQTLQTQLKTVLDHLTKATTTYDPEAAAKLEQDYQVLRSETDQLAGRLPEMQQRLTDLIERLKGLEAIAQKRDAAQTDLKKREKVKRFVNFARRVYKEAGPRITEQYARAISYQADKLFRELIGRPNVALEWTSDYEIMVQEGTAQRRFINLSGGEQMCAALAVRLALLRVLADIDLAFFDEPTTNMDRSRRESLAEAIGRIRSFQQLFVISHDDTFEKVTENVIFLERAQD
jgi:exonuclease SbcC